MNQIQSLPFYICLNDVVDIRSFECREKLVLQKLSATHQSRQYFLTRDYTLQADFSDEVTQLSAWEVQSVVRFRLKRHRHTEMTSLYIDARVTTRWNRFCGEKSYQSDTQKVKYHKIYRLFHRTSIMFSLLKLNLHLFRTDVQVHAN